MIIRAIPLKALFLAFCVACIGGCGGGGSPPNPPGDLNFPDLVVGQNPSVPGVYYDYDGN